MAYGHVYFSSFVHCIIYGILCKEQNFSGFGAGLSAYNCRKLHLICLPISSIINIHLGNLTIYIMQLNQLVHILKNGYAYQAVNEDGESYQVLVAPNKHMIKAAGSITQLAAALARSTEDNAKLFELLTPNEQKEFENARQIS